MNWNKTPEQIVNEIDNETGMNWNTDSILCLLTNFIQNHGDQKEFEEYVKHEAALQSKFGEE
jgi:hypothetical protein